MARPAQTSRDSQAALFQAAAERGLVGRQLQDHGVRHVWEDDARRMAEVGIQYVRIGEFAWSKLEPRPNEMDFGWLVAAMCVIPVIAALIGIGQNWLTATVGNSAMADLRTRLFAHLQTMELAFFTATKTGLIECVCLISRTAPLMATCTTPDA